MDRIQTHLNENRWRKRKRSCLTLNRHNHFRTHTAETAELSSTSLHTHGGFCPVLWVNHRPLSHLLTLPHSCKLIMTKVWGKLCGSDRAKRTEGTEQGDQWVCSFSPSCRPAPLTRKQQNTLQKNKGTWMRTHLLGTSPHPGDILLKSKTSMQ